ncbi:hypothetical protein G6F42_017671 [Rhizopus arrhizus]|nr:hypothetical protein G6F42_017671 [Rhizopus arrhizus]
MSNTNKVQCPICGQWVVASKINAHIDANCPEPSSSVQKHSTHMEIDDDFPKLEITVKDGDKKVEAKTGGNMPASKTTIPKNSSSASVRIAPLFTPKSQQQQQQQSKPASSSLESRPMPTFGGIKRSQPFDQSSSASTSSASTSEPSQVKRKRADAALESMPLAARVRPISLTDFVGQEELLGPDGLLKKLIDNDRIPSMLLWGPPGCGKTTIARIISKMTKSRFVELSATSHGTADVKKAFDDAKGHLMLTGQKTMVLFI